MIRASIDINGKIIHQTYAVNISDDIGLEYGKGEQLYEQHDCLNNKRMTNIRHDYDKGSIELAIQMLERLKDEL